MSEKELSELARALIELRSEDAKKETVKALDAGLPARDIVTKGLSSGMREIGKQFKEGNYFISELIMAAYIMSKCMDILQPVLEKEVEKVSSASRVVIGTVKGDIHNLGKNIVIALLSASGFEVHDLGVDVPAERFMEEVRAVKPDILGMSALLTTTAPYFKVVINALKEAGLRERVYVMIGGPPTSDEYARKMGADAYCEDAIIAVEKAVAYIKYRAQAN